MSFDKQLKNIMNQINIFKATDDNSLPQNTFYLGENQILCRERDYGVSRFAYDANGLTKNAIDVNDQGERRVMHGWGDKMSYKIGSWCDPDGNSRYSSTANSFWAISGMINNDLTMKEAVMQAFKTLNSKYGIMTFDKAFSLDMHKYVGRIANITAGTYENAGTYVHATMFAVAALFLMGEPR